MNLSPFLPTATLRATHIAETALYVNHLDRAIKFYGDLLSCPILRRDERFCVLRLCAAQVLLLFLRGHSLKPTQLNDEAWIPGHDGAGPLHVCFGIQAGEVAGWEQKLEQLGIAIESRVGWPNGAASIYFRDRDNHLVELATPNIWE